MLWFNQLIAWTLPLVPKAWVGVVARQYIAGETLDDAVAVTHALNQNGCGVTLDLLGEDPLRKEECARAVQIYESIMDRVAAQGLGAGISVKPSHMGLKLDPNFCRDNLRHLVQRAGESGCFVRIDMEDASLCDATLEMHRELAREFDNVGVVLQSYLRRSLADATRLGTDGANVRLCKG
ncbi:MAG: proline dehydrogenase family protein, partial [Desulfobacterales bacterium]|nr:proline dehydrogenase family protein [Desulfobacterales bacterium]